MTGEVVIGGPKWGTARNVDFGPLSSKGLGVGYFRVHPDAAPLKRTWPIASSPPPNIFPRSSGRGSVEATSGTARGSILGGISAFIRTRLR